MYSNSATSRAIMKGSAANNIAQKSHVAHKNSIDSNPHQLTIDDISNAFNLNSNEFEYRLRQRNKISKLSQKTENSGRPFKNSEYSSTNFYANEYASSAHTSHFTFGATPDSRISDKGLSGANSVNKSITRDKIIYSMKESINHQKSKDKHKKSVGSDRHHRADSK